MKQFTDKQKERMLIALENGSLFFQTDLKKIESISNTKEKLESEEEAFLCEDDLLNLSNLHLISIAETGFDLNGEAYFNRYTALPAIYVAYAKNDAGTKAINEIYERHPDLARVKRS